MRFPIRPGPRSFPTLLSRKRSGEAEVAVDPPRSRRRRRYGHACLKVRFRRASVQALSVLWSRSVDSSRSTSSCRSGCGLALTERIRSVDRLRVGVLHGARLTRTDPQRSLNVPEVAGPPRGSDLQGYSPYDRAAGGVGRLWP